MPKNKTGLVKRTIGKLLERAINLYGIDSWSGWGSWGGYGWPRPVLESFTGAWQQNVVAAPTSTLLSFSPVFACVTGIAADVSKMRVMLSRNEDGIWTEVTENQPWLPLLRNPNHYQDHIQFFYSWMLSKLMYGNTYVLKGRDGRRVVDSLYILHPSCIKPLVAPDSSVYYELERDDLSGIDDAFIERLMARYGRVVIPASEIIHDRMAWLWHPLVGVSPLYACGVPATMGNTIQNNSMNLFANGGRPTGIINIPGPITQPMADALKEQWQTAYTGTNIGKTGILTEGMTFQPVEAMTALNMQLTEQLKLAREDVALAFHYPIWKLAGSMPPYTKPDQAQTQYYIDCLQIHIEQIEKCLKDGLELPLDLWAEFDLEALMRMDTEALYASNNAAKGWMKLDEQRYRANLPPLTTGGDTVYLQHQDYSVEALAKRDAKPDPFANTDAQGNPTKPAPAPMPSPEPKAARESSIEDLSLMRDALAFRIRKHVSAA